jgi:hypothetical protein
VKIRRLFAVVALTTGFAAFQGGAAQAADPSSSGKKSTPAFGFSALKSLSPEAAKARAETWLKSAGKFDEAAQTAFEKIWADESRTVLDRTADSLVIGNPEAARILADARQVDAPAPAETPRLLLDPKQDTFFRSNIALAFARAAAGKKAYEEALEALNGITTPEIVVDPAALYFFKAVAEQATMRREAAGNSILRLLDDVPDAPSRYRMVATRMFFELQFWSADPKDLSNIERLMDNSGRRLELARPGEKTQSIQKKIVFRLDELIKELENKNKPGQGQCNGGNCPNGGSPGSGNGPPGGNTTQPSNPAGDSVIMGGSGSGKVNELQLRQFAEKWGSLPPSERAKIQDEITRDAPAKYKETIENYFKSLNRAHGFGK